MYISISMGMLQHAYVRHHTPTTQRQKDNSAASDPSSNVATWQRREVLGVACTNALELGIDIGRPWDVKGGVNFTSMAKLLLFFHAFGVKCMGREKQQQLAIQVA